jgi:glycosyltransferase involved in cell wall biosynthesis
MEASALIAVSPAVTQFLVAARIPPNRVHTIPNGIGHDDSEKKAPALPGPPPHVACIGQIALRKGQDLFAQAARVAWEAGIDATFLLVGERYSRKQESIEFERQIHSTATPLGHAGRWFHLGYRDDVFAILSDLAIVVVPSRQEPLSRVAIEALSAGVPTIATNVGGNSFILKEGKVGYLTQPNPEAIADAIKEVLSNRTEANRRARLGQEWARDQFSISQHATRVIELYRSLLQREIG